MLKLNPPQANFPVLKMAQKAIEETRIIQLSVEDQRAIAVSILNTPPLTPAMERAIDRYRSLIGTLR